MKKIIIAAALFASAGLCVSAELLPIKKTEPPISRGIASTGPINDEAARNLGTAD
ncbi:hypothetical protein [Mucilaginibacter pallidiroseus]|uniref:hypothetical protein n=1 Tax=Mucilaginibacter pallidiroseus TaxID=2599295 RepID=UPI0016458BBA|nr:hypothetical protein [Mucilaginibacter pallidiroseus]